MDDLTVSFEDAATYTVHYTEGDQPLVKVFRGGDAFTQADEFYAEKKKDAKVTELSMSRKDGCQFAFVGTPIQRGEDGRWGEE